MYLDLRLWRIKQMKQVQLLNNEFIGKDVKLTSEWVEVPLDLYDTAHVLVTGNRWIQYVESTVEWSNDGVMKHHIEATQNKYCSTSVSYPIVAKYVRVVAKVANYTDNISAWVTFK